MKTIAMAYAEYPSTTAQYLASAFRSLGYEVQLLALQQFRRAKPNIAFRYLERSVPFISWVDARRWLKARRLDPELFLWVESPRFVEVKVRRPFPCPTAAYVIDTHTRRRELTALARQYDTVFVAQKEDAVGLASEGLPAHWLPLAADPETHLPVEGLVDFDVGFVGNIESTRYRERFALLRSLSQEYSVHVVRAYGTQMSREYCRCRIGFNKSLRGDLNMRVFEIMAMGVPLVTDRIGNGLTELFEEGTHFVGYSDPQSLRGAIRGLLRDDAARRRLGVAARERVLAAHTYLHRARDILFRALGETIVPSSASQLPTARVGSDES